MKIGNVAFTCIRLVHGATTSVCVCVCVWESEYALSPACGMPPSSHAQKILLSVQWSIFYATLQQTEPQMNHMHTPIHLHTHTLRSRNIHTHTHTHTNEHTNRHMHRVAVRRKQWHWQWKLQQHVPIVSCNIVVIVVVQAATMTKSACKHTKAWHAL